MAHVAFGRFIPGRSWVHRLDPRAKLIAASLLMAAVFFLSRWFEVVLLCGLIALATALSGLRWRELHHALLSVSVLMCVSFFLQLWFTPGEVLLQWGPVTFTRPGLFQGMTFAGRLALLACLSALLGFTTHSSALTQGIERLVQPLSRVGLRTRSVGLALGLGLRFVPLILEQGQQILKAQRARGIDFSQGSLLQRAHRLLSVFIPLFEACLLRAHQLALAMDARGYQLGVVRSCWQPLRFGRNEWLVLAAALALTVLILN
ncbi:MAG TPA: energy-coupling factor transporter transmembrane component T [Candidatus Bipolaricaulota bacterium]